MFDSGAGSSYLCTDVITKLNQKPARKEQRCIEKMYGTMRKVVEVYGVTAHSLAVERFSMDVECINAKKHVLTHLPNPNIKALKKQCGRFRRLSFSDEATRSDTLQVHIISGAADYQRVPTTKPLIWGQILIKIQAQNSLCLDGLPMDVERKCHSRKAIPSHKNSLRSCVRWTFQGSKIQGEQTTYTKIFSSSYIRRKGASMKQGCKRKKEDHVPLPTKKSLSVARLNSTIRKLERMGKLEVYDQIMREQVAAGIMELVPPSQTGKVVHQIPDQAVIREKAETTKMRIVCDCS